MSRFVLPDISTNFSSVIIHPYHFSGWKRTCDIVLSGVLLVGLSPGLGLLALASWLTAGRPIVFTQRRVGWQGTPFTIYKFRTMRPGAAKLQSQLFAQNEAPAPMFKLHRDPRFVGIGRWLSNTGLDELPQLINIWRGEMSFVGPRPLPVAEAETLLRHRPDWAFRHTIKPGVLSEWSLDDQRHRSLTHWQALDLATVQQGGFTYELTLILTSGIKITQSIVRSIWPTASMTAVPVQPQSKHK